MEKKMPCCVMFASVRACFSFSAKTVSLIVLLESCHSNVYALDGDLLQHQIKNDETANSEKLFDTYTCNETEVML